MATGPDRPPLLPRAGNRRSGRRSTAKPPLCPPSKESPPSALLSEPRTPLHRETAQPCLPSAWGGRRSSPRRRQPPADRAAAHARPVRWEEAVCGLGWAGHTGPLVADLRAGFVFSFIFPILLNLGN
jgi:hypothetical protein